MLLLGYCFLLLIQLLFSLPHPFFSFLQWLLLLLCLLLLLLWLLLFLLWLLLLLLWLLLFLLWWLVVVVAEESGEGECSLLPVLFQQIVLQYFVHILFVNYLLPVLTVKVLLDLFYRFYELVFRRQIS